MSHSSLPFSHPHKPCLAGDPGPDIIVRDRPKPASENAPVYGLVAAEICTQTDVFVPTHGFRGFPSAHTNFTPTLHSIRNQYSDVGFALVSFASRGFLSCYVPCRHNPSLRASSQTVIPQYYPD